MRNRLLALTAIAAASMILVACGSSDSSGDEPASLEATAGPATVVPADAPLYFQALVKPGDEQTKAIKDVVSKVSNGELTDPGGEVIKAIEESSEEGVEIDYEADIEPWLGASAAVFSQDLASDPQFAVVIESTDKGKAEAFVEKSKETGDEETTYKGTGLVIDGDTGVAVTDDYVLIGDVNAVKAALDVEGGDSLAGNTTFQKTAKTVRSSLAFGYMSIDGIKNAVESSPVSGDTEFGESLDTDVLTDVLEDSEVEAIGIGAQITSDSVALEVGAIGGQAPAGTPSSLLPELPADSLVALGAGDLGESATDALDQLDKLDSSGEFRRGLDDLERETDIDIEDHLLSWMGDGTLFVRGTGASDIGGALIVETNDAAATEDAIDKLEQLTELADVEIDANPITDVEVDEGFEVDSQEIGTPVQIAVKGDRFVIAIGNDALEDALEPAETLGSTDAYKDATHLLPGGSEPALFVDIPQIVDLVENLTDNDPEFQEVRKYVDAFGALIAGTRNSNGSQVTQVAVGINE